MKIGIITFPGSNCDHDIYRILSKNFSFETELLWHADTIDKPYDLLILPGGFSYGDYLRPGAISRFSRAMRSLQEHASQGRPVIGICNGFQILCESGLLPGVLIRNTTLKHIAKNVAIKSHPNNLYTNTLSSEKEYVIPISHSDGNYRIEDNVLNEMKANNQIAFQYVQNPNGSVENIAGVTDKTHKVLGMMPHPERAVDPLTGGTDGNSVINSLLNRAISLVS